jgi:ABC-2 type transport system permease protein
MKLKTLSLKLIRLELVSILANWFIPFFGVVFPLLLGILLVSTALSDVPEAFLPEARTGLMLSIIQIIPLAVILLGHSSIYSQELENKIPLRMRLFGFPEHVTLIAKLIAEFMFMTLAIILYVVVFFNAFELIIPSSKAIVVTVVTLYLEGIICFMLAHGVANFFRKFGPTYAVTMVIYFALMMIGGMMGLKSSQLPASLRFIASMLPFTYVSRDFIDIWKGVPYSYAPFIQSLIVLGSISAIVLVLSIIFRKNRAV